MVQAWIDEYGQTYQDELVDMLEEDYGVEVDQSTISRCMKRLLLSNKVVSKPHTL